MIPKKPKKYKKLNKTIKTIKLDDSHDLQLLEEITFKEKKDINKNLVSKLNNCGFIKEANKVEFCGENLVFSQQQHIETKDERKKLRQAHFCKFRFCAMCNWRRNINIKRELFEALTEIEKHKKVSYLFLTLTMKNALVEDLRATVDIMNKSFNRLSKRVAYKKAFIGHFKAVEIIGDKTPDGEIHPHFHILLVVNHSYFKSRNYLSQKKITKMWQEALRVDYTPIVHIQRIRAKDESKTALQSAIFEVAKYSVKHTELSSRTDSDFIEIIKQTKGMRFFGTGGELKNTINFIKCDEELINLKAKQEAEWIEIALLIYKFIDDNYRLDYVKSMNLTSLENAIALEKSKCDILIE